eukprot:scaffold705_cov402-Prasinococcus_capsulatus_cf.AAC.21
MGPGLAQDLAQLTLPGAGGGRHGTATPSSGARGHRAWGSPAIGAADAKSAAPHFWPPFSRPLPTPAPWIAGGRHPAEGERGRGRRRWFGRPHLGGVEDGHAARRAHRGRPAGQMGASGGEGRPAHGDAARPPPVLRHVERDGGASCRRRCCCCGCSRCSRQAARCPSLIGHCLGWQSAARAGTPGCRLLCVPESVSAPAAKIGIWGAEGPQGGERSPLEPQTAARRKNGSGRGTAARPRASSAQPKARRPTRQRDPNPGDMTSSPDTSAGLEPPSGTPGRRQSGGRARPSQRASHPALARHPCHQSFHRHRLWKAP